MERSGLCLECPGDWSEVDGRIVCNISGLILNKCPKTTCRHKIEIIKVEPPHTVIIIKENPFDHLKGQARKDFMQIGDARK